jgi:hypothetical protein
LFRAPRNIEEEGIAAPAREEMVVAGLHHACLPACRDWRALDDSLSAVVRPGGVRPFNASQRRRLRPSLGGRELHSVRHISDGVPIRINPELVSRFKREGLGGGGSRRTRAGGRMKIHDQNRLASVAGLGKRIQIGEVEACVSAWESEVGAGIMV